MTVMLFDQMYSFERVACGEVRERRDICLCQLDQLVVSRVTDITARFSFHPT